MSLNFEFLVKRPRTFLKLTGVSIDQFKDIVKVINPIYKKEVIKKKKDSSGRKSHLSTLEDKLLCLFMYYRCYITHEFLGCLFNLHNSNICRLFKILEPILVKKIHIEKDRTLTKDVIEELLIDATEQSIQRPIKHQRQYYSGKKKRHTIKHQIIIDGKGKIHDVSKTEKGKKHDFAIFKDNIKKMPIAKNIKVDSGYNGINKYKNNVEIPKKKSKKHPLTKDDKANNTKISRVRIKVENKIRELKIFKILSDTYRNFTKKHDLRFNIIAGIVNLKNGFLRLECNA